MQDLCIAIICVLQIPIKESLNTKANLLPLKGISFLSYLTLLFIFSMLNKNLLISSPPNLVCLLASMVSTVLSLPAKSIKDKFP